MKIRKILFSLFFTFVAVLLLGTTSVNATEYEEKLIYRIAPDGKNATFKTIKPKDKTESDFILSNVVNVLLNEEGYIASAYCTDEDLTNCVVGIGKIGGEEGDFSKTYNIKVTYDEPEENEVVNSILSKMKKFDDGDDETYYYISDLNLINLYMTNNKWSEGNAGKALKYSEDFIKLSEGGDVSFYLDMRAGGGGEMYEYAYGEMSLFYNGYNYANMQQGIYLKRVIYIPENTEETREAYISSAQKRINDYLGTDDEVKVTYGGTLDSLKQENFTEDVVPREKTDGNYYNITVKGKNYKFYIMKGSEEKVKKPKYKGKHIKCDIKITTDDSTVPLDTNVTVKPVKDEKINKKIGTDNYEAYDIKLYSDSKKDWIKKLENGKFSVSIPISEKLNGKKITVYYIDDNNQIEEYETVVKDGYAIFETNHFSTYVLAEKVEEKQIIKQTNEESEPTKQEKNKQPVLDDEPKTGIVDIKLFIGITLIILVVGIARSKRKNG